MKYKSLSLTYAKALMKLGEEHNIDALKELSNLQAVINASSNLKKLFFLDVFTREEKRSVFCKIAEKMAMSVIVKNFIIFLFSEKRAALLPFILEEIQSLDDAKKGLVRGTLEGSEDNVSDDARDEIKKYLKKKLQKRIKLTYKKTKAVTAGHRVVVGDLLLDISLEGQLDNFKRSVLEGRLQLQ